MLQIAPDFIEDTTSTTTRTNTPYIGDTEFRGHSSLKPNAFFGIHHTLTEDISQAPLKCLVSVYARLKETTRRRYNTITL